MGSTTKTQVGSGSSCLPRGSALPLSFFIILLRTLPKRTSQESQTPKNFSRESPPKTPLASWPSLGCGAFSIPKTESEAVTKDKSLTGVGGAILNRQRANLRHPWNRPDNHRCLIKSCTSPVYHNGEIYWSLCLRCLEDLQLGPFRPKNLNKEDYS